MEKRQQSGKKTRNILRHKNDNCRLQWIWKLVLNADLNKLLFHLMVFTGKIKTHTMPPYNVRKTFLFFVCLPFNRFNVPLFLSQVQVSTFLNDTGKIKSSLYSIFCSISWCYSPVYLVWSLPLSFDIVVLCTEYQMLLACKWI